MSIKDIIILRSGHYSNTKNSLLLIQIILCFEENSLIKNLMEMIVIGMVKSQQCQLGNWTFRLIFVEVVLLYYHFTIDYEALVSYLFL